MIFALGLHLMGMMNRVVNQVASFILGNFDLYDPPTAPSEYVTDATGKVLNITDAQFLSTFYDGFVGTQTDGMVVTKTSLGMDESNTYHIYEYDFCPENYTKTILLSSGMHPYELSASFGLAQFINHMMATPYQHNGFRYLRENVRVKVIPIINPWGWNQNPKKYGNVNGVNINRNFDYGGLWAAYPVYTDEWNKKGESAFSEAETVVVRDWILANSTAEFYIDMHTGIGIGPWDNFIYYQTADPQLTRITYSLSRLDARITSKYSKANPSEEIRVSYAGDHKGAYLVGQMGWTGLSIEQTPNNLLWGTSLNNESGDISEFEATICAYVFTFLSATPILVKVDNPTSGNTETVFSIQYKLDDNEGGIFTVTRTIDGVSTTENVSGAGTKTWDVGTLGSGTKALSVKVTDNTGYESNTLTYSILVSAPVAVTGVSLNKSTTSINIGSAEQLTETVAPSDAANKDVTWSSSNTNYATVSSSGLVTAVAAGSATITVTTMDGNFTSTCSVTVIAASTVIADTYTRSNNTNIGNTEVGNKTYVQQVSDGWEIVSGKLKSRSTDSNNAITVLADSGNYDISVDVTWRVYAGITFRYSAQNNHIVARINSTSLNLFKNIDGTVTSLGTPYSFTPVSGTTYKLRVVANGSNIKVFIDGTETHNVTETFNQTYANIGFRTANDTTTEFDNLEVYNV